MDVDYYNGAKGGGENDEEVYYQKEEYKVEKEEKPLKSKKSTTKSKWYFDIDVINSQHEIREKKPRPYKCKLCNKTFTVKGDMNKHVLFVHEGIKYPCRACPREFPTSSKQKRHFEQVHLGKLIPFFSPLK